MFSLRFVFPYNLQIDVYKRQACRRSIYSIPDCGGVSRPSMKQWKQTLRRPLRRASSSSANTVSYTHLGLAALLVADDDKAKFNWAATEYSERLLSHCPAQFTAVQEMI